MSPAYHDTPTFSLTSEAKYQLLVQISQKVRDTLDLDQILELLLDMLQGVLPYDAAGIFVLNEDLAHPRGGHPRALIAGVARRGFDQFPEEGDRMLMHGEGINGWVIHHATPAIVPDVRLDTRYVVGRRAALSEMAVPLMRGGRAIGALDVESDRLAAFDQDALEVLRFFADAAAISIEKATLHRRLLEQHEIENQIRTASAIQSRLLPAQAPHVAGYDLDGVCTPTFAIGGDYFDFIPLAHGRLGLVVADVSGDGIPAALVMSAFRALLRTQASGPPGPGPQLTAVNRLLHDFCGEFDFVTAAYVVLDPLTGVLQYSNCGHPDILLCHADGRFEALRRHGPPLNMDRGRAFTYDSAVMQPGSLLALFTDGVFEVMDDRSNSFGLPRLKTVLRSARRKPAGQIIAAVQQATRDFCKIDYYPDDFTLVVLRRLPLDAAA